eukprot:1156149-Pelagomonas_calceolata.AAC.9
MQACAQGVCMDERAIPRSSSGMHQGTYAFRLCVLVQRGCVHGQRNCTSKTLCTKCGHEDIPA